MPAFPISFPPLRAVSGECSPFCATSEKKAEVEVPLVANYLATAEAADRDDLHSTVHTERGKRKDAMR